MLKKIVKCSAQWCHPCKTFKPIFEEVAQLYENSNIEFTDINVDTAVNDDFEFIVKNNIKNIPTTLFVDENGEVINKIVGLVSKQQFIQAIEDTNKKTEQE